MWSLDRSIVGVTVTTATKICVSKQDILVEFLEDKRVTVLKAGKPTDDLGCLSDRQSVFEEHTFSPLVLVVGLVKNKFTMMGSATFSSHYPGCEKSHLEPNEK